MVLLVECLPSAQVLVSQPGVRVSTQLGWGASASSSLSSTSSPSPSSPLVILSLFLSQIKSLAGGGGRGGASLTKSLRFIHISLYELD